MNKFNWDLISRVLISLVFLSAGYGKLMNFSGTSGYIDSVLKTGAVTPLITALVIFIEIVVALIYISGKYKRDTMAYILIGFTALATILFHKDFTNQMNQLMALKNLAIIGGLLATLDSLHKRRS